MQDEATWLNDETIGDDDNPSYDKYEYFMRPEPRDNLGPIEYKDDEWLGEKAPCRQLRIGMVRNAKEEDKKEVTAWLKPYPHIRIDKAKPLQGWYQSKINRDKDTGKDHRPRPCFTEAVLTEPYGGWCAVGCAFCYVNSGMRGYRGTGLISVPLYYGDQIRDQLSRMRRGAAGYFSSFTDPFLPLEDFYHNTQQAAEEFEKVGLPIFFLSRLRYPEWAIDLLRQNPYSYAQKSINTPDPEDWRKLSPGAMPLEEHFEEISRLKDEGIYVSIQVNPVVPGVTPHSDVLRLFSKLSEAGADHVIVKFVEAGYSWAATMTERIRKRFGDERGARFRELFVDNIGGQRTVSEEYRLRGHELYSKRAKRLGMTYATCYEYRYERDSRGDILSKTGVSIGRDYTTADQCHGHRVPVHTRDDNDSLFHPVDVCPPSGCLYCSDDSDGEVPCGDELAAEANAVRWSDLKQPIGKGKPRRTVSLPLVR